jgi:hypothetical protein
MHKAKDQLRALLTYIRTLETTAQLLTATNSDVLRFYPYLNSLTVVFSTVVFKIVFIFVDCYV